MALLRKSFPQKLPPSSALDSNLNRHCYDFNRKVFRHVVKYPEAKTSNAINITLTYGYDIGISSKWNNYVHYFNPADLSGSE